VASCCRGRASSGNALWSSEPRSRVRSGPGSIAPARTNAHSLMQDITPGLQVRRGGSEPHRGVHRVRGTPSRNLTESCPAEHRAENACRCREPSLCTPPAPLAQMAVTCGSPSLLPIPSASPSGACEGQPAESPAGLPDRLSNEVRFWEFQEGRPFGSPSGSSCLAFRRRHCFRLGGPGTLSAGHLPVSRPAFSKRPHRTASRPGP